MPKNFNTLLEKISSERRERIAKRASEYRAEQALYELREARRMTQVNLATVLNINQPSVSKIERQTDMYVSTLRSYIEAMGGALSIEAVFPDGRVKIIQFDQGKLVVATQRAERSNKKAKRQGAGTGGRQRELVHP